MLLILGLCDFALVFSSYLERIAVIPQFKETRFKDISDLGVEIRKRQTNQFIADTEIQDCKNKANFWLIGLL